MAFRAFPFGLTVSSSGEANVTWLSEKLGRQVQSARLRDFEKIGGMSGEFFLLDVTFRGDDGERGSEEQHVSLALKTTNATGPGKMEVARSLGTPREGLFYAELAPQLAASGIPKAWYAHGDLNTGEKLVLMECLNDAVPCGVFFGAGNPNNWGIKEKLADMSRGNPTMQDISKCAFGLYAKMHARFWKDEDLLNKHWLRGSEWLQGRNEDSWQAAQQLALDAWAEQKALLERDAPDCIKWDKHVVACLDRSLSGVSWKRFQDDLESRPWTVVHGDCHPHNALWINQRTEHASMALIDFEMVGVGSPAQELGQYMVSHMPPDVRRSCERELVKGYHEELCSNLRSRGLTHEADRFTLDECWREYVMGGAGRWCWFVPYLAKVCPVQMGQYFHDQLAAFLHDHLPNSDDVGIPRV
eukprot:TRINITY_DN2980_c0_g3_i1.p1 TRINITY_DN2980_c0_g3~~TRINITY_DN2980_c0_g3_i1.p1  ORF type:complete len:414 (-),score=57.02 TRINITY_DN2980_c0_g3_i1:95-1336(-)